MTLLRKYRFVLGSLVAALMLAAGGMSGAAEALSGPEPSFPLCTPDGAKFPAHDGDPAGHCDLCLHSGGMGAALVPFADVAAPSNPGDAEPGAALADRPHGARAELSPVTGRGPPSFLL